MFNKCIFRIKSSIVKIWKVKTLMANKMSNQRLIIVNIRINNMISCNIKMIIWVSKIILIQNIWDSKYFSIKIYQVWTKTISIMNKHKITTTLALNITLCSIRLSKNNRKKLSKMCTLSNAKKGKITQHLGRKILKA
jgi:hypothetical protein